MSDILLLNGPNLNMLGTREPSLYGTQTLEDIVNRLVEMTKNAGLRLEHYQNNSEAGIIEHIQGAPSNNVCYIVINPAAFTHTSIAIRDALLSVDIPFTEVHLSNVYKREDFRQKSYFSDIAEGVISGFGMQSYELAIDAAIKHIQQS